jgi:hypothetical protein
VERDSRTAFARLLQKLTWMSTRQPPANDHRHSHPTEAAHMPVKRRQAKKREDLSAEQEAWLQGFDRAACFFAFLPKDELAGFWAEHGDRVIEEHVAQWPGRAHPDGGNMNTPRIAVGTYPDCWYDGKLPEPRMRLGGVVRPAMSVWLTSRI